MASKYDDDYPEQKPQQPKLNDYIEAYIAADYINPYANAPANLPANRLKGKKILSKEDIAKKKNSLLKAYMDLYLEKNGIKYEKMSADGENLTVVIKPGGAFGIGKKTEQIKNPALVSFNGRLKKAKGRFMTPFIKAKEAARGEVAAEEAEAARVAAERAEAPAAATRKRKEAEVSQIISEMVVFLPQ